MKKTIHLSVGEFALPSPRQGSIEALSGFGDGTTLGTEIHQRLQRERETQFPNYESEVRCSRDFEAGPYLFRVSGRMDGLFTGEPPRIEEIKTAFNIGELEKKLTAEELEHPYRLQLLTYGYFYWLNHEVVPDLSFHLVSTRHFKAEDLSLELDIDIYEKWLARRLDELIGETDEAEKRVRRRKQVAQALTFPFAQPRQSQIELIQTIEEGLQEKRRMLVQAPTGLGKTVGVLFPTLKEALSRGQRVVYITPKNSQHAVAEEAMEKFRETGHKVKSLTITAKSKICMKNEPLCNPQYCEYAKDHYTKVAEHKVLEQLSKKRKLTAKTFKKMAVDYQVCPFEIQLDAAKFVDTVICDYNYALAPSSSFGRLAASTVDQEGKPNLVIDEAHNVPSRAMEYYSPQLSTSALELMRQDIAHLPKKFQSEADRLLDTCIDIVRRCQPKDSVKATKIEPEAERFLLQDEKLREFLNRYLESDAEIQRRDFVLRLYFYWSDFTATLVFLKMEEREEFFITYHPQHAGGAIKITCCDASQMLRTCYDDYQHVVGFSATLKPFEFYSRLAGLESKSLKTAEFASPFPKSHRKLLIVPQVSSKFSDRARNYPRIADAIAKISALKKGNYFAFFPSFDFMEKVLQEFSPPFEFQVIKQNRHMRVENIEEVLERLREQAHPTIVFAVQGGVFSEGVDYPGEMVVGAFVVGTPLPSFDLEREQMKEYYERHYSAGFDYAYTYPAMAKAVQAAGRVIRSETDRGLIVLMDDRFTHPSFEKSMPADWFDFSARELVSQQILREVSDFWIAEESAPSEF